MYLHSHRLVRVSMLKVTTMDTWASELDHGAMEEGGMVWGIKFSLTSHGRPGASLTCATPGITTDCSKKASQRRQCDALDNVMLGNFGCCHPCECSIKKGCQALLHPFIKKVLLDCCGIFQQDNSPCDKAKLVQKWHNDKFKVLIWPPDSPDIIPIEYLCNVLDKEIGSQEAQTCNFRDLKDLLLTFWHLVPRGL